MQDIIFIRELKVLSTVGTLAHEKKIPQTLIINCEMECDLSLAAASDKLSDSINYVHACDLLLAGAQNNRSELLEQLANNLINALFSEFSSLQAVKLSIQKPGALQYTPKVGIEMRRTRPTNS